MRGIGFQASPPPKQKSVRMDYKGKKEREVGSATTEREGGRRKKETPQHSTRVLTNEQEMKIQPLYSVTLFQISNGVSVKDSYCTGLG